MGPEGGVGSMSGVRTQTQDSGMVARANEAWLSSWLT
ncbi:hypothetical protein CCACVL1_15616 [Corchorus capsularis]|uniref:Uncharacterized protein n=1 Tax=Corchorus capsularis TaxID=210143 RepID=A0A1R3I1Q1_COCAP|nr:hypothetical protein CCACVL1_15616 [Corchorus capsularis]